MTKTEKANKILLAIYEELGEDQFEKIDRIYNWESDYALQNIFSRQLPQKTGVHNYVEFCQLILQLREREFITIKNLHEEDEVKIIDGYENLLTDLSYIHYVQLTNKGIEKCKELMKEKKITQEGKANKILLWIYEKIGDDEYADIPSIGENNFPGLGMEYKDFCVLLIKLRDKGLISMNSENENSRSYLPVFTNISLEKIGIKKCMYLNVDMVQPETGKKKKDIKLIMAKELELLGWIIDKNEGDSILNLAVTDNETQFKMDAKKTTNSKDDIIVTYCWDNETHKQKVLDFVHHLRKEEGFNATFDRLLNQEETALDFNKMMHLAMTDYKKVIIVLSKGYKEKAEKFTGGVGNEFQLIIKDIETSPKKYILISFEGISDNITPLAFKGRNIIDLSNDDEAAWNELRSKLRDEPIIDKPPVAQTQKPIKKQEVGEFNLDKKTENGGKNEIIKNKISSKSKIYELIANDRTEEALKVLQELSQNKIEAEEITLLSSRFNRLRKKRRLGTISDEKASLEINKINSALLELTENL